MVYNSQTWIQTGQDQTAEMLVHQGSCHLPSLAIFIHYAQPSPILEKTEASVPSLSGISPCNSSTNLAEIHTESLRAESTHSDKSRIVEELEHRINSTFNKYVEF